MTVSAAEEAVHQFVAISSNNVIVKKSGHPVSNGNGPIQNHFRPKKDTLFQ